MLSFTAFIVSTRASHLCYCVTVLVITWSAVRGHFNTAEPGPGKCSTADDPYQTDSEVFDSSVGSCNFTLNGPDTLCSFRQGCRDAGMASWTTSNGYFEALQTDVGKGGNVFSTLESPWLHFTSVSCVQFTFSRNAPTNLDVFFAVQHGDTVTVENRSVSYSENTHYTKQFTVFNLVGKILFRAIGGGGQPSLTVKLYTVSVQPGQCEKPGISITGPPSTNFPSTNQARAVTMTESPSTDTSSTHQTSAVTITGPPSTISPSTSQARVVTSTGSPSTDTSSTHQARAGTSDAATTAADGNPQGTSSVLVQDTSFLSSANPMSTNTHNDLENSAPKVAAIAESAGAVVIVVIAVSIAIVFIMRRRYQKRANNENNPTSKEMSVVNRGTPKINDYSIVCDAVFPTVSPSTDSYYYDTDGFRLHDTSTDIDPYDVPAEDGYPGKTRTSTDDTYNHISPSRAMEQKAESKEADEDTYNHIRNPKENPSQVASEMRDEDHEPGQKIVGPHVVNGEAGKKTVYPRLDQREGDYDIINHSPNNQSKGLRKAGDENLDPYNRISTVSSPEHTEVSGYEVVQVDGHQSSDEYNTLSFETRKQAIPQHSGKVTRNAYDHVMTNPDDTYSKAVTGMSTSVKVIDSDYDHVKM